MAQTESQWYGNFGIQGATSIAAFGIPKYHRTYVYIKAEYDIASNSYAANISQNPYSIEYVGLRCKNSDSNVPYLASETLSVPATGASASLSPFWYRIKNVNTGVINSDLVHESALVDLAGLKTYLNTEITNDVVNPPTTLT